MLTLDAQTIATALGGHRSGKSWMAPCPAHKDATPSLSIRDADNGQLLVKCHAGCTQNDVITALRARKLWSADQYCTSDTARRIAQVSMRATPNAEERQRTFRALKIWTAAQNAEGSPVETYLAAREITVALPRTLKFHHALKHPTGALLPSMIGLVTTGTDNRPVGIHRTFLNEAANGKAEVTPNKMLLGPSRGGAVRLGPPQDTLLIGEGIETCLAAMQATGMTAWAALSTSGMITLDLPTSVRAIIILADADEPGERAATKAAARWLKAGRRVRIARPPQGLDFNDVLRRAVPDGDVP
jgi:putative DNA primase/helicase